MSSDPGLALADLRMALSNSWFVFICASPQSSVRLCTTRHVDRKGIKTSDVCDVNINFFRKAFVEATTKQAFD